MADRWTVIEALRWTTGHLNGHGIDGARLEAERMLSQATGLSRVELYASHDRPLTDAERAAYREAIKRRAAGEPLQYVIGEAPFRHLVLKVRPGVFIPRPETELLVQAVIDWSQARAGERTRVLDLCTGTGAVALSLARELEGVAVVAVDVSPGAVACAQANATRLGLTDIVEIRQGDLFDAVGEGERFAAIVANPPYVPQDAMGGLDAEVREHEPALALDGGEGGLDVLTRIIVSAPAFLEAGGLVALEVDETHAEAVAGLARDHGFGAITVAADLAGRDRIVTGVL